VIGSSFSRDHRWVAFGGCDASLKVLDLHNAGSSKPEQFSEHSGRILSLAFSPDSRFLIARGMDPRVPVWDPEHPRQAPVTLRVHEGPVWRVGFRQPFIGHPQRRRYAHAVAPGLPSDVGACHGRPTDL
jgi:WD40 repeat protein